MAEAMFKQMVRNANLQDQITVDSAGTSNIAAGLPSRLPNVRKSWTSIISLMTA
jgi:Protein-tyrosine-phosphatase